FKVGVEVLTDVGLELGGWNIDDVKVLTFDPTPTGCLPVNYGSGLAGTPGLPAIDSAGQPSQLDNADFVVAVKNGLPLATAYIGLGFAPDNSPLAGGTILILPSQIIPVTLDVFGQVEVSFPVPSDPAFVGVKAYFQSLIEDPGAPGGFAFTPGLEATVCPWRNTPFGEPRRAGSTYFEAAL
ncbi:MAG: hypothetical protein O7B99_02445, partial [Planctomycetota bacterium]|nr:hypothetical protein [Planctomycetota bacterium]